MSRIQTNPDFFRQVKALEQRISRLERVASTTTLKDVNTTGLTSAQIDAAVFSNGSTPSTNAQPTDGLIISDSTNGLLLIRQDEVWNSFASTAHNVDSFNGRTGAVVPQNGDYVPTQVGFARGTATITWPGGATYSNYATVAHGLGTTPAVAMAISSSDGFWATVHSTDATNVTVQINSAVYQPPAGTTSHFMWIASR